MMVMFRVRRSRSRSYLFGLLFVGVILSVAVGVLNKPEKASAGGGDTTPPATCSISAWQNGSSLSWGYRMSINAPNAAPGSVLPGHPGIYSPWPPYLSSPGANYYVTYSSSGNKTVYGRYSYTQVGSSVRIEVQCSRTITASTPQTTKRRGCTNPNAINYDWLAEIDDGSCIIRGCTNPSASNYNPQANQDDGSCPETDKPICDNPIAINFGGPPPCRYRGCMNPVAINYNPSAVEDDGSCIIPGCTNPAASNYNWQANRDDGSCIIRGCTDPGAANFNSGANQDDGSCIYPGCTDPSAINYDPHANQNDGSCIYDECLNIAGVQYPVPPGLAKSGSTCYFPQPTCTPNGSVSALTGDPFTFSINVRNNSVAPLDISTINYSGPGGIAGTPNNGSSDIGGNGSASYSGTHSLNNPTSGTVRWNIAYVQPYGLGNASVSCELTISVRNRPPTCEALTIDPLEPLAGQGFRARVRITNPNPSPIYINRATYRLENYNGDTDNETGSAQGVPSSISTRGIQEFTTTQNIRVYDTSYDINIVWDVNADSGDASCDLPNNNDTDRPDIILLPPTCTVQHQDIVVGIAFTTTVSVQNTNPYAPIDILDSGTTVNLSNGTSANATGTVQNWNSGIITIPADSQGSFVNRVPPELIFMTAGDHRVNWRINSEAGFATGDCDLGLTDENISAYTRPYVRFYGNDVFAGGEYGETCTVSGDANARGYGLFSGSPSHATYRGAASELVVFAIGEINGVLPGAQATNRPSLGSLSFSNTSLANGLVFGGSYGSPMCVDDYWAEMPQDTATPSIDHVNPTTGLGVVDLNDLANDSYYYSGSLQIVTSSLIPQGTRITLYVEGDVWIGDNTFTGNGNRSIAYDAGPWADTSRIPIIRIISLGNIYVDNNINQLDGLYVAIPEPSDVTSGQIHTCALSESTEDLRTGSLNTSQVASNCNRQLVVNGAFVAQRVELLRLFGNIGFAQLGAEPATSNNIAEVFRFSPELYMSLIGVGKGAATTEFDGMITLPPAL